MSERGFILALQRLHDDPGFGDMVRQDPQATLGIYDLDDQQRDSLLQAIKSGDESAIRNMASAAGLDWSAERAAGVGSLSETEISTENQPSPGITGVSALGALPGDGYEGVHPSRPAGT